MYNPPAGPGSPPRGANPYTSPNASPLRRPSQQNLQSEFRRSSIPSHLRNESWAPHGHAGGSSHARRGSVVDIAADFLGPQGHETLEKARRVTDKAEDWVDAVSRPVRPFLPGIGRFLIVVTFLEDALRIVTQMGGKSIGSRGSCRADRAGWDSDWGGWGLVRCQEVSLDASADQIDKLVPSIYDYLDINLQTRTITSR